MFIAAEFLFILLFTVICHLTLISAFNEGNVDVWAGITEVWRARHGSLSKISSPCRHNIDRYIEDLENNRTWAFKVWDASGHYPGSLYAGNGYWLGSLSFCQDLNNEYQMKQSNDAPPYGVDFYVAKIKLDLMIRNQSNLINVGFCLPESCSSEDVQFLINSVPNVQTVRLRRISNEYSFWLDSKFSLLLTISTIIIISMILGTWYDLAIFRPAIACEKAALASFNNNLNNNNNRNTVQHVKFQTTLPDISINLNQDATVSKGFCSPNGIMKHDSKTKPRTVPPSGSSSKVLGLISEILVSFSLPANISKICGFDVGEDTLTPIHGIRFLSILWIILIHSCLLVFETANNKLYRTKAEDGFLYHSLSSGTFSVDTFFFISGLLVSFLYFRTCAKFTKDGFKMNKDFNSHFMQFFGMSFYRFFRLTPPYLIVLWIVEISMKHFRDHSVIEFPSMDYINCEMYWWRNIFYINTFYPSTERCMTWSWYLADDTQFYCIGIILLIISLSYFKLAVGVVSVCFVAGWGTTAAVSLSYHHVTNFKEPFAHYDALYDKPWSRIGPYLVGMCTGWFLFHIKCNLKISKLCQWVGWTVSITVMLSCVYGLHYIKLNPLSSAIYVAFSHTAWALGLAWVMLACVTGYGGFINSILSWKYLYPFSRLTYCVYLIHPQVMRSTILGMESPTHVTRDLMIIKFVGFTTTSYAVAFILSLMFEAPFVSLLRIMHPLRHQKNV